MSGVHVCELVMVVMAAAAIMMSSAQSPPPPPGSQPPLPPPASQPPPPPPAPQLPPPSSVPPSALECAPLLNLLPVCTALYNQTSPSIILSPISRLACCTALAALNIATLDLSLTAICLCIQAKLPKLTSDTCSAQHLDIRIARLIVGPNGNCSSV
ncbi:hypothetical protein GOP47_0019732 [Adiantum capillus-veneris]|uniref:Bifunctional inhibitor/plant lipid transfer protein/seed storage helical domain-containing protein n=1 Tax=Adiantum capillus-veneris TaxID=13818 RepID=A0A9D4UCC0_ADICA|nr:hypothetical protein GOP47_0019732 [Adiantum capillus-veneris]